MQSQIYKNSKETWLETWEPKTKTLTAFIWLMGMLFLENPIIVGIILISLFAICILSNKNIKQIFNSLKIVLPFVIFSMITLIFSNGLNIREEAINFAMILGLRVLASTIIILMLVSTQSFQTYLNSMNSLNLPPVFMTTLFLTTRYTTLLMNEFKHIKNALKSRLFKSKGNKNTINTYANVCGGMIVKGIDRSEAVYKAMKSRGFCGTMPVNNPKPITKNDLIKLLSSIILIIIFVMIDSSI